MEFSVVTQEALKQLTDLGIEEEKAREALLKYNNDVGRAADFYFQNINSDDPMNNLTSLGSDNVWGVDTPRNDSESNNIAPIDLTGNDTDLNNAIEASLKDHDEDYLKRGITASLEEASSRPSSAFGNDDNNQMAVVLYNPNVNKNDNNSQVDYQNNWSHGPEQPIKRVKLDTTPLGLKPIMNSGYACPFFQALFHIPIFRLAVFAYRPTRNDWGEVEGYWNGESRGLSVEGESMDYYTLEFKSRPYTTKFMHELQKIFGFLSLSQRAYGDASSLMNALAYEETKNSWPEWEVYAQDFITRMLDVIVNSLSYCDLIDFRIPDSLSKYIISFNRLLKSVARDEIFRRYDSYHYQSEKKDEDVLNIPLDITPSCNTIYAALDQIVRHRVEPAQKVFFIKLAKILILNIKYRDSFTDISFTSGDSGFHIDKELYMDRYLLSRAEDVEKRWCQLGSLKSEFEKINQDIRNITEYQGRHNGSDLLKGSIDYFRRKCDKARKIGDTDDVAQKTCSFLEGVLEKIEQKLKVLLEKREEIEAKIKDIFNTPDMRKCIYRLKAVLVSQGHYYHAYIWVSKGNKAETISSNNENGTWWKFSDMIVEETSEEHVLKDTSGLYINSGVYTLIYVNADVDYNFPNINDLIPPSLKEYVEKDNRVLDEELSNDFRSQDYDFADNDYANNYPNYSTNDFENPTDFRDDMDISDETPYNPDSIVHDNGRIECDIDIIIKQAENMGPLNPKISVRFEIFCIKLEQIDLFKSLMRSYYDLQHDDVSWDEPRPFNMKYQDNPSYKGYVNLFDKYKEITLYLAEGLERMTSDEYKNAPAYFKHAINLEKDWVDNYPSITDNGGKLRRSKEIDAFARTCLKIEHEGFLGKIRCKQYLTNGLKDGLQFLQYIVGYIGESNCTEDELFKQFRSDFQSVSFDDDELTEEQKELIHSLNEEYIRPKKSIKLTKPEAVTEEDDSYKRYETNLKTISSNLKKYEEIANIRIQ